MNVELVKEAREGYQNKLKNKLYEYKILLCVEYDENEPTFVNAFIKKLKRVVKTYHLSKILNEIEWEFN